jgi:hypothetical protein
MRERRLSSALSRYRNVTRASRVPVLIAQRSPLGPTPLAGMSDRRDRPETVDFARRRSSIRGGSASVVRNAGGAWRSRFVEHVGSAPLRARARRPATPHLAGSPDRRRSRGGCLVVFTAPVIARDRNQSCRTIVSSELLTLRPPLYSMSPSLRNLFMKKFTRERVAPIISASVSWEIFGNVRVGLSWP